MTKEEWNRVRHIVLGKLMQVGFHIRHVRKYMLYHEPYFEEKNYHLDEIDKEIQQIENWFEIERRKHEEQNETRG